MSEHRFHCIEEDDLAVDLEALREDYAEWSQLRYFSRILLLVSATASRITIEVDGEEIAPEDLVALVPCDGKVDEEIDVRISTNQAELTPSLAAPDGPERFALERTDEGLRFEPLLELLEPKVPKILKMATRLFERRTRLLRRYPRPFREEPSLLHF